MNSNTYKLDITPGGIPLVIHISQYDVGLRQYTFQPFTSVGEFAYVPGATVTLEATKPDGYAVIHDCTYSSDGIITYTLQEQLAAKPGKVWSKVVIRVDSDVLGTGTIVWMVDEAGVKDSAIVSESDVSGIHGMVDAEVKNAMFSFLPTESTNGTIAHFDDGADDVPVKDLKIGINPVQDLNGYAYPWAGGAGKNVLPPPTYSSRTTSGITLTNNGDGTFKVNGTATAAASFILESSLGFVFSSPMILNGCPSGGSNTTYDLRIGTSSSSNVVSDFGSGVTLTAGVTYNRLTILIRSGVTVSNIVFKPMIRLASDSDDTYAPYANICPISGWTGATITHKGSNLVKFVPVDNATHKGISYSVTSDGRLTMSGTATANSQPYYTSRATAYSDMPWEEFPAGTYTVTCLGLVGQSSNDRVIFNAKDCDGTTVIENARISSPNSTIPTGTGRPMTFTATKPFKFGLYVLIASGSTVNCTLSFQMEVGDTVHEYETLNEQTYPISWETEAGTVYGGTLDATTGVLTVTHIGIQLTSSQTWASAGSVGNGYRFYQTLNPACDSSAREIKTSHWTYLTGNNGDWGTYQVYNGILFIKNQNGAEGLTSVAAFKSWLDANNAQVCYPLATPQTYQLTSTEVRSLLGINNILSDTGDTEVEYKADAQAYMDKRITTTKSIIAGIETGYTASQNYTTGQFLIVGDNLYKVTANIASGATIAVGTNVVSTTVAEQLIALASS